MAPMLEMHHITKRYGDLLANDNVNFRLERGEVHAIVGENGAGKSTLMKILYGMESPTSGEIRIEGRPVRFRNPVDAIHHGIGMVHQHFMLFPPYTIAENVVAGHEPSKYGFINRRLARRTVSELASKYRLDVDPDRVVATCPVGIQQRTEILKVLYRGAEVLILDEPTAVLTPLESTELIRTLRSLAEQGKSVVLITHKLNEVMAAADRVTVLRNGKITGVTQTSDTSIQELSKLMVGRDVVTVTRGRPAQDKVVLHVENVLVGPASRKPLLDSVSFQVRAGEIVGIAGVSGNGQSELLQALTGLRVVDSGQVTVSGVDVTNQSVQIIRSSGVAHIPEDRQIWGSAADATVEENMIAGHHHTSQMQRRGFLRHGIIRATVKDWIARFRVKVQSPTDKIGSLSGGNVQKAIFARELSHQTPLLIAAEPTRGVDISAVEFIHGELMKRRDSGGAILLVSSDLPEIMALSDRILVMYEGRVAGEIPIEEATEERISLWMTGGNNHD